MSLITDSQLLVSAAYRHGVPIPIYDDGNGPIYIFRDSMGISGIVRAATWEDAYEICQDEFFPECGETVEELRKEYGFDRKHVKMIKPLDGGAVREDRISDYPLQPGQFVEWRTIETPCEDENGWIENELFQETYGFRPNGPNDRDVLKHGIYTKDFNGESLDLLSAEDCERLSIVLEITEDS